MKYTKEQALDAFEKTLEQAQDGVDFGPMNGFGGYNCDVVWKKLPEWFKKHYDAMRLPHELLVGKANGIARYADACSSDEVEGRFLKNTAFFIECYEDHHNVKIIDGPSSKTEPRSGQAIPRGLRDDAGGSKSPRRSKKS